MNRVPVVRRTTVKTLSNARLATKIGKGLELSVDWATKVLKDPDSEKWERAQAMTFFAKLQHHIEPADAERGPTPMDKFLTEMAKIRELPPQPLPEPVSDLPDEDEDGDVPVFEAPAS